MIYCKGVLLEIDTTEIVVNKAPLLSNVEFKGKWIIAIAIGHIRKDAPVLMSVSKYNPLPLNFKI